MGARCRKQSPRLRKRPGREGNVQMTTQPIAVRFPLAGEWCAVNTPGYRIPSHGTDQFGQRYAYDFLQIDWKQKGYKFHHTPVLRNLIRGVPLRDAYGWSKSILSPFDGEVVEAMDGLKERDPVHFIGDMAAVLRNAFLVRAQSNEELHPALGNFIVLKMAEGVYSLIAHARAGSVLVAKGQRVKEGQQLAQVGHSGNSTAPHLHFQLMDNRNLVEAKGLPCCFKSYQVLEEGFWKNISNGIPVRRERVKGRENGHIHTDSFRGEARGSSSL